MLLLVILILEWRRNRSHQLEMVLFRTLTAEVQLVLLAARRRRMESDTTHDEFHMRIKRLEPPNDDASAAS